MKSFSILTQVLVLTLLTLISGACAPQAAPTPIGNATDVENTMVSEIVTMLAETHAAIPTTTPTPTATATVTNTPAATATFPIMPTLGETFTAIPGGNSGAA